MQIQQQPHIRTETEILDLLFQHNHIFQGNPDTPQVERITAASSKFFSRPPLLPLHIYCDHAPSPRKWHKPGDQPPQAPR